MEGIRPPEKTSNGSWETYTMLSEKERKELEDMMYAAIKEIGKSVLREAPLLQKPELALGYLRNRMNAAQARKDGELSFLASGNDMMILRKGSDVVGFATIHYGTQGNAIDAVYVRPEERGNPKTILSLLKAVYELFLKKRQSTERLHKEWLAIDRLKSETFSPQIIDRIGAEEITSGIEGHVRYRIPFEKLAAFVGK